MPRYITQLEIKFASRRKVRSVYQFCVYFFFLETSYCFETRLRLELYFIDTENSMYLYFIRFDYNTSSLQDDVVQDQLVILPNGIGCVSRYLTVISLVKVLAITSINRRHYYTYRTETKATKGKNRVVTSLVEVRRR